MSPQDRALVKVVLPRLFHDTVFNDIVGPRRERRRPECAQGKTLWVSLGSEIDNAKPTEPKVVATESPAALDRYRCKTGHGIALVGRWNQLVRQVGVHGHPRGLKRIQRGTRPQPAERAGGIIRIDGEHQPQGGRFNARSHQLLPGLDCIAWIGLGEVVGIVEVDV